MKWVLLLGCLALAACSPSLTTAPVTVPDPLGATLTQDAGPNYTTLTYLPGKALTRETVAHLVGPALRVNDARCLPEPAGLACKLGLVLANERRVIYVSGLSHASVDALRPDGSKVHVELK
ncbi:hypothetical protein Q0M94_11820 [Deinococcus radiomollis]|uniref:hypothetical protein n=1 Tax=Deinococcus radiomollis TaxID=468916 RepID=UPI00389129A3